MALRECWLGLLILVGLVWLGLWLWVHGVARVLSRRRCPWPRRLRPCTPQDCPACCQATGAVAPVPAPTVPPWRSSQRRRGRPQTIATAGHACPNPACPYYGITDAAVHALVGYGHHGAEHIQDFRCQACQTKVSARRDTALYRLKTPATHVSQVLTALAEGLDLAAAGRVFGHSQHTVARWLARGGTHAERLHARHFRSLVLPHLQLDELRTRLRGPAAVCWLWLAVDPLTKAIPALHLGRRDRTAAHALVHALVQTLAPGCLPVFTSDGLDLYFAALTAHFGQWVTTAGRRGRQWQVAPGLLYGQVRKLYRQRRVVRVWPRLRAGTWAAFRAALSALGLSGQVTTAFVERVNLTLRRGVASLARRTWATARTAPGLLTQVEWWRGYYHWVRPHGGLRVAPGARPRTPAMALGLTDHCWTVAELLAQPVPAAVPGG